ncbi:uncharacterized protein [Apostichopus japonicus]|uniref:uncharacterized protein isoform X3 n=1 Tax=Stichopus japonicus TaxID=307972 RepID=UPI003AB1ABDB
MEEGNEGMERAVCNTTASVMIYDDANRKWVQAGNSAGVSRVQIYQHQQNNTYRVVGRLKADQSVVINSAILKGLKYNQATPTFHQWRDSRQVYGLNFHSPEDAENFSSAMLSALEKLSAPSRPPVPTTAPPQAPTQVHNGPSIQEEIRQRPPETQNQRTSSSSSEPPALPPSRVSPDAPSVPASAAPPVPPSQPPAAPPAPPAGPPAPPAPPPPPSGGGPPPPPPPPPPPSGGGGGGGAASGGGGLGGGLAAALAATKLKKTVKEEGGDAPPPAKKGGGMQDMMSEIQMKLKKRQQTQNTEEAKPPGRTSPPPVQNKDTNRKPWERNNPAPVANRTKVNGVPDGSSSPKISRVARRGSMQNGNDSDLEKMKQEILTEMRKEMQKLKVEIIDAIKQELGKS